MRNSDLPGDAILCLVTLAPCGSENSASRKAITSHIQLSSVATDCFYFSPSSLLSLETFVFGHLQVFAKPHLPLLVGEAGTLQSFSQEILC